MAGETNHKLGALFSKDDILCQTPLADGNEVIKALADLAARHCPGADADSITAAIFERGNGASPLVPGYPLAVPHVRLDNLPRIVVAVATSSAGIRFGPDPNSSAKVVVLILAPSSQPGMYLQVLSAVARSLLDRRTIERVASLRSGEEVWQYFNGRGLELPAYVCAADIMNTQFVCLRDTDTLKRAIDLFAAENLAEIPVLDQDGDLVGVVSENELLHVCLPDYILWMEDLSPIINFQPFAEILKNEGKTWLHDIMTREYSALQCEAPAIQVAKEMARHDRRQVYVVRSRKLAGIITLQDFVNKVLRE